MSGHKRPILMPKIRDPLILLLTFCTLLAAGVIAGCDAMSRSRYPSAGSPSELFVMGMASDSDGLLESQILREFGKTRGVIPRYIPSFETVDSRLKTYERSFEDRSSSPDLLEIDVIWPSILANDLLDLTPYAGDVAKSFAPEILSNFWVGRKLLALPRFVDVGVLYYRGDLLAKYGFRHPPKTWDELGYMSRRIQEGERRSGVKDFWGYVWQGGPHESLTCNALEWQASEGGGAIIGNDGVVQVNNPGTLKALKRAASWVGTISPPGVIAYVEDDSVNLWNSGKVAFMRNWTSFYGEVARTSDSAFRKLGVAPLPGGSAGSRGTLGGFAMAVSKYSARKELSVDALKALTSEEAQIRRIRNSGCIPTRISVLERQDLLSLTPLKPNVSKEIVSGIVARPSLITGALYPAVSKAYCKSVHDVLTHKATAEAAMAQLETELVSLTGFRPARQTARRY